MAKRYSDKVQHLLTEKQGILRHKVEGSERPIYDPAAHAHRTYGGDYRIVESLAPWDDVAEYHTTAEFAHTDKGYINHCGPTALTNAVIMLTKRKHPDDKMPVPPAQIFSRVAKFGQKFFLYNNVNFMGFIGGTSDVYAGIYIGRVLKMLGIKDYHVTVPRVMNEENLERVFREGGLAYLMLHKHECYKNHHVICNGLVILKDEKENRKVYLKIMDGWSRRPAYIDYEAAKLDFFWGIQ